MASVLNVHLPHQVLWQQLSRLQVISRGRCSLLELAFGEIVLSHVLRPLIQYMLSPFQGTEEKMFPGITITNNKTTIFLKIMCC